MSITHLSVSDSPVGDNLVLNVHGDDDRSVHVFRNPRFPVESNVFAFITEGNVLYEDATVITGNPDSEDAVSMELPIGRDHVMFLILDHFADSDDGDAWQKNDDILTEGFDRYFPM